MKERLVVIGNGMAPGRALERLFETEPDRYQITIFNAEPRVNYDRIMLSPVLSGEKQFDDIIIHGDAWYIEHGITLYKGHKIVGIDREARTVTSNHGEVAEYDKLIVATGSVPFILPLPGKDLAGVLVDMDEAIRGRVGAVIAHRVARNGPDAALAAGEGELEAMVEAEGAGECRDRIDIDRLTFGHAVDATIISAVEQIIFGVMIIMFLIFEPLGLARLWQLTKERLRLWPFRH